MTQLDLSKLRYSIEYHIGRNVKISSNKGRHKFVVVEGIIKETYPNLFLVEIDSTSNCAKKTLSFSYRDVMTKDVRMILCS